MEVPLYIHMHIHKTYLMNKLRIYKSRIIKPELILPK